MLIDSQTPIMNNFFMPSEFYEHQATWMLWPERTDVWRLGAKPAQKVFAEIANTISKFENVIVGVNQSQYENARNKLTQKIRVIEVSYDDAWIRDTGPTFLINNEGNLCGVDWHFNAWGGVGQFKDSNRWELSGSYFPWKLDDLVARKILEIEGVDRFRCPLILEGGAFQTDGNGTLIATKECILGRNNNRSQSQIEELLSQYLGIKKIIWLDRGLYLEENNGHIDNMCCFVDSNTILINWCDDIHDPQFEISSEAYEVLISAKDLDGNNYNIVKIRQPPPLFITNEEQLDIDFSEYAIPRQSNYRLPASYINSYFCNGAVIIPSFSTTHKDQIGTYDADARIIYEEMCKNRKVIQIPVRDLLIGGGGIHCVLQQIPKRKQ
ncbi:MAG: agmatine deiminase [Chloroflexi bacterium HGW-Chloroflexi-5]|jgi:agmatine deiminase|nr:MAG: agmatine deiminase [Chloroflexi bacterium HGW-Chloroflexi-5]